MPKTFSEKILAKYSGKSEVVPGEIVEVTPDVAMSHDNTAAISKTFAKIGVDKLFDPDIHVIVLDHCVPAANATFAQNHKDIREFVKKQGIKNFYDINNGICHQVLAENGHCLPGSVMTGSDSHTTTYGAFGAFAAGVTRSETAVIMATGKIWFRVPETMRIQLTGQFNSGVYVKDLALAIMGKIRADGALYRAVEFDGSAAHKFSVSERLTLCNMAVEMGAKAGYVPPDETIYDFLKGIAKREYEPVFSDEGCEYIETLDMNLGELEPMIACPHTVDNVKPVSEVSGENVEQVFVGSCSNARLDDLAILAHVLRNRKIDSDTRLIVIPASSRVMIDAMRLGYIDTVLSAGGTIATPGCGPCMGNHMGVPASGEKTLSTSNRNFKGRMGNPESEVFLASPHTAAVTAVTGKISDPGEIPVDWEMINEELSNAVLSPVITR
ncbi:MAG: 3-isopropylmalate dehydratase large subunit [Candidatus Electryonea clarkiae]|nr:3-isopropylmalate dehydratase large subunit [Candidatus Electryonea clarkiae]MDP8287659.1 3-isopropylmalate dehydratase large subunit [Candidatus Electryonea clarkiae]